MLLHLLFLLLEMAQKFPVLVAVKSEYSMDNNVNSKSKQRGKERSDG